MRGTPAKRNQKILRADLDYLAMDNGFIGVGLRFWIVEVGIKL